MSLTHGMVLAAGLGTRMRPLTATTAKPLLTLRGRSLLDHALDRLAEAGVREAVVNAHWQAEKIAAALAARAEAPATRLQLEPDGDAFWLDGPRPALARLAAAFDPARMDALLLLVRTAAIEGEVGRGDFQMDARGALRRPRPGEIVPFLFGGVQVMAPALLAGEPEGRFSLNRAFDRALAAGRLHGLVHDGQWFHLSTPPDLARAERRLAALAP